MKKSEWIFVLLFLFLKSSFAFATLGERINSDFHAARANPSMKTSAVSRASTTVTSRMASEIIYQVHETKSDGQIIREYVKADETNPSDEIVFAVTWRGISEPDLSLLLGSYYQEAQTALTQNPRQPGRAPQVAVADHVIIEKYGHMRDVRGRAYIPKILPSSIQPQDLQ